MFGNHTIYYVFKYNNIVLFIININNMKYNKLKLIQLIGEWQKKHKETYDSIALSVGLSANMVGLINNGKSIPSVDSLGKFAEYFGKDINYFYDIETPALTTPSVKITEGNDYLLKRFEEIAEENGRLKERLKKYEEDSRENYTVQNVPNLKAAEPNVKLEK